MRVSEADLQTQVIDLAHLNGWLVAHFRPARTKDGWRTPVAADGKGFPDLVLARSGRVLFAELKSDSGRLSVEQQRWLNELRGATPSQRGTHSVHVWRPKDFDQIVRVLR